MTFHRVNGQVRKVAPAAPPAADPRPRAAVCERCPHLLARLGGEQVRCAGGAGCCGDPHLTVDLRTGACPMGYWRDA